MTFSIVARSSCGQLFGVAALTEMPAVGKLLSHAWPGAGAAATQAKVNPYLGIDAMELLRKGVDAAEALQRLICADPRADERQLAVIGATGPAVTWTGADCIAYAGALERVDFSVQGNRLAGPHVLEAMAEAYQGSCDAPFDERLIRAVEAGEAAGGDRKGERSANLLIVSTEEYPLWDIRVDEHEDPAGELRRLHDVFRDDVLPELLSMPTRGHPAGEKDETVI
ncbi:MAG: DUF1028 domain-containing protein [Glycocaulis sp.]|uniref:DUF1028 domain-containing protein n=1 Tax=Glycocaulis sp. TaxID=1969725 RepID=UPI003F6E4818